MTLLACGIDFLGNLFFARRLDSGSLESRRNSQKPFECRAFPGLRREEFDKVFDLGHLLWRERLDLRNQIPFSSRIHHTRYRSVTRYWVSVEPQP